MLADSGVVGELFGDSPLEKSYVGRARYLGVVCDKPPPTGVEEAKPDIRRAVDLFRQYADSRASLRCDPATLPWELAVYAIAHSPPDDWKWALDRCSHEVPLLQPVAGSSREVACWLHRDGATPPPELSLPEPAEVFREYTQRVYAVARRMLSNDADGVQIATGAARMATCPCAVNLNAFDSRFLRIC